MPKSPDAFRTISEVADWLGIQAHVLRFWESKFTQVKPIKRAGGRRYYRPADMLLLGGIRKLLHDDGLTIKGVQKILREDGMSHVAAMSMPLEGSEIDAETIPAPRRPIVTKPAPVPEAVVLPFEPPVVEDTPAPEPPVVDEAEAPPPEMPDTADMDTVDMDTADMDAATDDHDIADDTSDDIAHTQAPADADETPEESLSADDAQTAPEHVEAATDLTQTADQTVPQDNSVHAAEPVEDPAHTTADVPLPEETASEETASEGIASEGIVPEDIARVEIAAAEPAPAAQEAQDGRPTPVVPKMAAPSAASDIEQRKARDIGMPVILAEKDMHAQAATLTNAYRINKLDAATAQKIQPLLEQLAALRDRMAARRGSNPAKY